MWSHASRRQSVFKMTPLTSVEPSISVPHSSLKKTHGDVPAWISLCRETEFETTGSYDLGKVNLRVWKVTHLTRCSNQQQASLARRQSLSKCMLFGLCS